MSIRTELIDAKLSGNLHKTACDMLAKHITSYADFCEFCELMEKEAMVFDKIPDSLKSLMLGAGALGTMGVIGGNMLSSRAKHNKVLGTLMDDPQFPDKNKVKEIYNMMVKWAPKTLANPTYATLAMVQLYNSPMVTPDMVGKIVEIENKVSGESSGSSMVPGLGDIQKAMKGMRK